MYRIGEFSKMSKTTVKALRYYDETGILKPEVVDPFTGYRFYTTKQLFTLHKIHSLRQIGLSIEEIGLILSGINEQGILEKRKQEILDQLAQMHTQLTSLTFILENKEDFSMNYVATLKDLPACTVYSTKLTVANYDAYFQLIPAIGEKVTTKYPNLRCAKPAYCFISYLDGEFKEANFHVEFCEAIEQMEEDFDDIVFKHIEAVQGVCVMHKGPYTDFQKAYTFIFDWIEKNGYVAIGAPRESYIDGIWNKKDPQEWLTEIQIPISLSPTSPLVP